MMFRIEAVSNDGEPVTILAYYVAVSTGGILKFSDKTGCHTISAANVKSITLDHQAG